MRFRKVGAVLLAGTLFVASPIAAYAEEGFNPDISTFEASSAYEEELVDSDAAVLDEDEAGIALLSDDIVSVSGLTGVVLGDGAILSGVCSLDQQAVYKDALNNVISWRRDALNDSSIKFKYQDTWYTVRDYLNKVGISESEYLNPKWSTALENIAIQRAVENMLSFSHTRPNGTDCFTAKYYFDGTSSGGEVLALGTSNISSTISLWASEKSDYVKEVNGQSHGVTGHYTMLVDPGYSYYGFAGSGGAWAGEASSNSNDSTPTNLTGHYDFYVAVTDDYYSDGITWYAGTDTTIQYTWSTSVTMGVGASAYVVVQPKGYLADYFYFSPAEISSSNPSVVSVGSDGKITAKSVGTATLSYSSGTVTFTSTIKVVDGSPMYRLYNPNSGEHLYTLSTNEYNTLGTIGWKKEGKAWTAPKSSNTPVYRLYNPYSGDHHYTTSLNEYNSLGTIGWKKEGIAWYSDDAKGMSVYRLFNPNATVGTHHYTTSSNEYNTLGTIGWVKEGVAWYGVAE